MTGGHVTPAIAVIDALKGDSSIIFFGRKYATEGNRTLSAEYRLITERGIPFISLTTGRLQRQWTWQTIPSLLKIPVGCIQSLWYCLRQRPALIVSFGGYVALPTALAAWLCRIPVITHEQTLVPGLANRLIAGLARRVCVTFPETLSRFPKDKAVVTGLPMRKELFTPSPKAGPFTADLSHYPLIYVTGGGTGAQSLNRLLFPVLASLLAHYTIVHQVGDASFAEAEKIRTELPATCKDRYIVRLYIPVSELAWVLSRAVIVLGRSGANTVMELAALGKVAIFVPLPWSAGGEQQKNAAWLSSHGGAVDLAQHELTPRILENKIDEVQKNIAFFQQRASVFAAEVPRDGTQRFVREIEHLLSAT